MHRHSSFFRALRRVLLMAACVSAARPCIAQAVSATSGSPAAIASIRQQYARIDREAPGLRQTTHDLENFSLEGGVLHGFFAGRELRKLTARLYGETWRGTEDFYFAGGRIFFIHTVVQRYDESMSGRVVATVDHRFYFDQGRLIRRVRTQRPVTEEDMSAYDQELPSLLRDARLFAACAASTAANPPECTAPDP